MDKSQLELICTLKNLHIVAPCQKSFRFICKLESLKKWVSGCPFAEQLITSEPL